MTRLKQVRAMQEFLPRSCHASAPARTGPHLPAPSHPCELALPPPNTLPLPHAYCCPTELARDFSPARHRPVRGRSGGPGAPAHTPAGTASEAGGGKRGRGAQGIPQCKEVGGAKEGVAMGAKRIAALTHEAVVHVRFCL